MNYKLIIIVLIATFLSGCFEDEVDTIADESAAWRAEVAQLRNELKETRKDIVAVSREAIKAIPGERWLQLVDGALSDDANERDEVKRMLDRLTGGLTVHQYSVTLRFSSDNKTDPIKANFFFAGSNMAKEVETLISQDSGILNLPDVYIAPQRTPTFDEKAVLMRNAAETFVLSLFGRPIKADGPEHCYKWPSAGSLGHLISPLTKCQDMSGMASFDVKPTEFKGFHSNGTVSGYSRPDNNTVIRIESAINHSIETLTNFFKLHYADIDLNRPSELLTKPWGFVASEYIFILIDEESFNNHKDSNLKITFEIYETENPSNFYQNTPPQEVVLNQFLQSSDSTRRPILSDDSRQRKLMWAPINISSTFVDAGFIQQRRNAFKQLERLEKSIEHEENNQ